MSQEYHLVASPQVRQVELQVGSVVSLPHRVIAANRPEVTSMIGLSNTIIQYIITHNIHFRVNKLILM